MGTENPPERFSLVGVLTLGSNREQQNQKRKDEFSQGMVQLHLGTVNETSKERLSRKELGNTHQFFSSGQ